MTLDAVDQRLAAWAERLLRMDDNLLALEAEPTFQMLSGTAGKRAPLDGITAARVTPALDALAELFEHRQRLTDVLDRAKEIRASVSALAFWERNDKLAEIDRLLDGASVKMSARPTPLSQRGLLDPAAHDVAFVPEALLEAMVRAFDLARDAVTAVARAWKTLEPEIEHTEREVAELRRVAHELWSDPKTVAGELAQLEGELAEARRRVAVDPLGVSGSIERALAPRVIALRQQLQEQKSARDGVSAALRRTLDLQRELSQAHERAKTAVANVRNEFTELPRAGKPLEEPVLSGLSSWREKLESTAHAGRWSSAQVGLARWIDAATGYVAAERAIGVAVDALISKRTELSGRLSARRAQMQALVARGLVPAPDVESHARQAEALLAARPTPLREATAELETYEAAVIELATRGRKH